jgi:hypothetical protein
MVTFQMTKKKTPDAVEAAHDSLVPDRLVRAELNIAAMTSWRWDRDPKMISLGWPPPIRIGAGRKYRSRRMLEEFKANLVRRAIEQRGGQVAE